MKSWIIFYQTPYNTVKYITSELDSYRFLEYYKFLEFIGKYKINNYFEFKDFLDKFKIIFLNLETGEWEEKRVPKKDFTFDNLVAFNNEIKSQKKEAGESKETRIKNKVTKIRNKILNKKKRRLHARYKDRNTGE